MASTIPSSCVKNTLCYGGITLAVAGLITMFVCGILARTGKLSIPYSGSAAMITIPLIILFIAIIREDKPELANP